jgi:hypothetical protein
VSGGWPTDTAWELLRELEDEPWGVSSLEVDRMLEEWGIVEVLRGEPLIGYRSRTHPALPHFPFHYPIKSELSPGAVSSICRAVRELHRRITYE